MITKMQTYFTDFPADSKLWVFIADEELETSAAELVKNYMSQFIPQWKAHDEDLKADFELIDNRFLIVIADESMTKASGCSIDTLTRFIKELESKIDISLTNRMNITYKSNSDYHVDKLNSFKEKVKSGKLAKQTLIYNASVSNLNDFWENFEQYLDQSWAAQLLTD